MAPDDHWTFVERQMLHHRTHGDGDGDGMAVLNRVFGEYLAESGMARVPRIGRDTCSITIANLTPLELMTTVRRHHRARPRTEADPPIMVCHEKRMYVVDGSNRINKWLGSGAAVERPAILIEVRPPDETKSAD